MKSIPIILISILIILSFKVYGNEAPNFWISNLKGKRFDSRKTEQPFILSFFYVNCIPCIKEIPKLYEFISSQHPEISLLFIDPIKDDSKKEIKIFSKKLEVPESLFYKDTYGSVSKKFFKNKFAFPTIIGVRKGKQIFRFNGLEEDTLDEIDSSL